MKSDSATNPANYEALIDKVSYGCTDAGYVLGVDYTNGGIYCEIDDDTTWTPDDGVYSTQDIYDAQWHHIVCISDTAQGKLQLYIDGKLISEDTSLTATGSLSNDEPLIIDDDNGVNDDLGFTGNIDELKIYRAALSASDVQSEFNQGKTLVLGATGTNSSGVPDNSASREHCAPGDNSTCSPPVGEWKFDERTGSSAFDTSGNNLTGTLTGNATFSTGELGSSILLDGTGDYISYGDILDFADGDAFTISLRFMPAVDSQVGHLVSKKLTGSPSDIGYSID